MEGNYFEKVHRNQITSKSDVPTVLVLDISKTFKKEMLNWQRFFVFQKYIKISTSNLHRFSMKIAPKNTSKQRRFFYPLKLGRTKRQSALKRRWFIEIMSNKVRRNNVVFSPIEITLNKVCRNDIDFSHIKITLTKVHWNNVHFSPTEITSTRYVEMTWKFVDIFSSMYRYYIAIKSTSIRRGVYFGY